jgi:ribosomal protein S12 methylthiotransferase
VTERYWVETLGCPKNQVDSDKLAGMLAAQGYETAESAGQADLVVVNTCAFIEAARRESIDTVLELSGERRAGARLVVTGCLAERHGAELAAALPEVDLVAGFGVSVVPDPPARFGPDTHQPGASAAVPRQRTGAAPVPVRLRTTPEFDLLNLPRPAHHAPWAYVKVAEGCDRRCGFCAIPSFRGKQRSRPLDAILHEVDALGPVQEVVLVAQDLASWELDQGSDRRTGGRGATRPIVELVDAVAARIPWVRLLYLYPSALDDALVGAVLGTGVPYFDLSLQHVSRPLVRRMRRWGDGDRFLGRIGAIRGAAPDATFRSSFILGYPGETEDDHDELLAFLEAAELDWAGFFPFSCEDGTYAADLPDQVPVELAMERLRECAEVQDRITAQRRRQWLGETTTVLVDRPGVGRSTGEAPEIDGVVHVPRQLAVGAFCDVVVTEAVGPDLWALPVGTSPVAPEGADGVTSRVRSGVS